MLVRGYSVAGGPGYCKYFRYVAYSRELTAAQNLASCFAALQSYCTRVYKPFGHMACATGIIMFSVEMPVASNPAPKPFRAYTCLVVSFSFHAAVHNRSHGAVYFVTGFI